MSVDVNRFESRWGYTSYRPLTCGDRRSGGRLRTRLNRVSTFVSESESIVNGSEGAANGSGAPQKRLNDDEREALMEAFHSWDHADCDVSSPYCHRCTDFVYDFEPLVCELIADRLVGFTGELSDSIRADALAPVIALAKGLLHPWDSATRLEILDVIEGK